MVFALGWVALMPSIGSLILLPFLLSEFPFLQEIDFLNLRMALIYTVCSSVLMGMAILPTTVVAILSGFFMGWTSFFLIIIAYTLATLFGYGLGRKLDRAALEMILSKYPKANELVERKRGRMGELIFFVRISPVIPFALSNLLFAMLRAGWKRVVVFGLFGMLPRTAISFMAGTIASDYYEALHQDGIVGKGWIFVGLLMLSFWGIYRFFSSKVHPS